MSSSDDGAPGQPSSDEEQVQVQPSSRICERVSGGDDDSSDSSDEEEDATGVDLHEILECYICRCKSDKVLECSVMCAQCEVCECCLV